jgi:hypothetical protein
VALLGILAVLLQAVLFGWHHHALALGTPDGQPVATAASAAAPFSPADVEDSCEICAALHHLSSSPVEFASLPAPPIARSAVRLPPAVRAGGTPDRGFHARAPPRAQHPCV